MIKAKYLTPVIAGAALACLPGGEAEAGPDMFFGEIQMTGTTFCPRNTQPANGQILPINQNQALFSLLGCTYGGDCRTSFALPDLRGRAMSGTGRAPSGYSYTLGQRGGREDAFITQNELPSHNHLVLASDADPDSPDPAGRELGTFAPGRNNLYTDQGVGAYTMESTVMGDAGSSSAPIMLRQPYQAIQFCVVTQGIFPSRN
jgi:microcystin-dependent protein